MSDLFQLERTHAIVTQYFEPLTRNLTERRSSYAAWQNASDRPDLLPLKLDAYYQYVRESLTCAADKFKGRWYWSPWSKLWCWQFSSEFDLEALPESMINNFRQRVRVPKGAPPVVWHWRSMSWHLNQAVIGARRVLICETEIVRAHAEELLSAYSLDHKDLPMPVRFLGKMLKALEAKCGSFCYMLHESDHFLRFESVLQTLLPLSLAIVNARSALRAVQTEEIILSEPAFEAVWSTLEFWCHVHEWCNQVERVRELIESAMQQAQDF